MRDGEEAEKREEERAMRVEVPRRGVTMGFIQAFLAEHRRQIAGLTTAQVCDEVVRPRTGDAGVSYAEWWDRETGTGAGHVAAHATALVVHAWSAPFVEVVDALEAWWREDMGGDEAVSLWVDLFVLPQSADAGHARPPWLAAFREAVQEIGQTVVVLRPGPDTQLLSRLWCLFELHTSIEVGAEWSVALSPSQRHAYAAWLQAGGDPRHLLSSVHVQSARATVAEDEAGLRQAMAAGVGAVRLGEVVQETLREWVAEVGLEAWKGVGAGRDAGALQVALASVLRDMGRGDEAEALLRSTVAQRTAALGDRHPDTLAAQSLLAGVLQERGPTPEALELRRLVLARLLEVQGPVHPDTLASMQALSAALHGAGQAEEAEAVCRRAWKGRRAALGTRHPDALDSLGALAGILVGLKRYEDAETLYRDAMAGWTAVQGRFGRDTLESGSRLAEVLWHTGNWAEAEALCAEGVAGRTATLGPRHPDTLRAMEQRAGVQELLGHTDAAEEGLRSVVQLRQWVLGPRHPDTLTGLQRLGDLLQRGGASADAETVLRQAVRGRRAALGPAHADTLASAQQLAAVLETLGRFAEAEAVLSQALRGAPPRGRGPGAGARAAEELGRSRWRVRGKRAMAVLHRFGFLLMGLAVVLVAAQDTGRLIAGILFVLILIPVIYSAFTAADPVALS